MDIIKAETTEHINYVRELFIEYGNSLSFNLCFQNFEEELKNLPGAYGPPAGSILLAIVGEKIAGCVALRKIDDSLCEMKRLYAKPAFRGKGIGRHLAEAIIEEAKKIGYKAMRLDTVSTMKEAISLYKTLGFQEIDSYRYNPVEGVKYMELNLISEIKEFVKKSP
jgi:ribosomal protein S18 acetylase RimI-like enzyme